jgi:hypothetical protein
MAMQARLAVEGDDASRLEMLLADIRNIFTRWGSEISSAALVAELVKIEGRPWAEMGRAHRALTQNMLARLLRPLGIGPGKIGPEDGRVNGYLRHQFEEAFGRYLASNGGEQPDSRTERDERGTSDISQPDSPTPGCPVVKSQKSSNGGVLSGCPVVKEGAKEGVSHALDGGQVGLSNRRISELADWYQNRAHANAQETGGDTRTAELDADLRMILRGEVLDGEQVELEFERVMADVFSV